MENGIRPWNVQRRADLSVDTTRTPAASSEPGLTRRIELLPLDGPLRRSIGVRIVPNLDRYGRNFKSFRI
jgi:hypothetical protein